MDIKKIGAIIKDAKWFNPIGGFIKMEVRAWLCFWRQPARFFARFHNPKTKYFLSVMAVMKNEGPYLVEWLEYHKTIGVEKFYLYDNESDDDTKKILAPYIKSGLVEYKYYPGKGVQKAVYADGINVTRGQTKWLAIFDLDEMMVPPKNESIIDLLKRQPNSVSSVVMPWINFGSAGHIKKPKGLVMENFRMRDVTNDPLWKTIVRPDRVYAVGAHTQVVSGKTIDAFGSRYFYIRHPINTKYLDGIRIHHYSVKSLEEFAKRSGRGDVLGGDKRALKRYTNDYFTKNDRNAVLDKSMDKYVKKLKK